MGDSEEMCPVCYEEIKKYGFCVTNCTHVFCMDCMVKAIKKGHDNCPICRKELCSTPTDPVVSEREQTEQYAEGFSSGHEVGYGQATIDCDIHIEQITTRVYNQGFHAGTEISRDITALWRDKYEGLSKIYKETVHQLQKTNTLSLPCNEKRRLTRSNSIS